MRIACAFIGVGLFVGCASSAPVEPSQRERDIQAILSETLDDEAYGEERRCLSSSDYRDFTALDDQRIIFEGRRGRYWLSTLPMRCPDLRHAMVLRTKSFSRSRICALDTFYPADWFDRPWYRRWPWGSRTSAVHCTLGEFQAISEQQAASLKALSRRK
jgi:hypothetical protein